MMRLVLVLALLSVGCGNRWEGGAPGVSTAGSEDEPAAEETAEAVDPAVLEPLDETYNGEIADGDFVLEVDGSLYDAYAFQAAAGASIVVVMRSAELEPYLHLLGPRGAQLAHGGAPAGESGMAEVVLVAPATGEYRVYANTVARDMRGAYELRIVAEPPPRPAEAE